MATVHKKHKELEELVKDIATRLTPSLVDPFTTFIAAYMKYYQKCAESIGSLAMVYERIGKLIASLGTPETFRSIISECHNMVEGTSTCDDEHGALMTAFQSLQTVLMGQSANADTSPELQREKEKLKVMIEELKDAEINLKIQKARKIIHDQVETDQSKVREAIQNRLDTIQATKKEKNRRLSELAEQDVSNETTHQFWIFSFSTTFRNDTSGSQENHKRFIKELEEEETRLNNQLKLSQEDLSKELIANPPAVDAAETQITNLKNEIEKQEKTVQDQYLLDANHILATTELGHEKDRAASLSKTIMNCVAVLDKLTFVRTFLVNTKRSFKTMQENNQKIEPHIALLGLTSIVRAPLINAVLITGEEIPLLLGSQTYQNNWLQVKNKRSTLLSFVEEKEDPKDRNFDARAKLESQEEEEKENLYSGW
eukprot:TRINITY_DN2185_c0_g1_i2.p1 TRINITY_DN2185_c0_g1~~TRINITY_DN2185_c0_g1_i2.p1  ORF type:complete len:428 (+),score=118.65 TRINITY_DN2185_c0_g1_i2:125-1408(+)